MAGAQLFRYLHLSVSLALQECRQRSLLIQDALDDQVSEFEASETI
jgi:hypothetical protein